MSTHTTGESEFISLDYSPNEQQRHPEQFFPPSHEMLDQIVGHGHRHHDDDDNIAFHNEAAAIDVESGTEDVLTSSPTTVTEATFVDEEPEKPLVPSFLSPTELSIKVFVLVIILSVVLAAANTYLGLFAGVTISVSIPSSILSLTILKPFKANILEINAVQTGVSAGSSIAGGLIYTIPAMLMLQQAPWKTFEYGETFLIALIGGVLGVLFTIPLRRALIVENKARLEFPEGRAITEVLKVTCLIPTRENMNQRTTYNAEDLNTHMDDNLSTDSAHSDSGLLNEQSRTEEEPQHDKKGVTKKGNFLAVTLIGIFCGLFMKFCQSGFSLYTDSAKHAWIMFGTVFYMGIQTSPALLGVGYIVKLRVAFVLFLGGFINSWIAIPLLTKYDGIQMSDPKNTPLGVYGEVFQSQARYIGVGCMLIGGITTFFGLSQSLVASVKSSVNSVKQIYEKGIASIERTDRDIPLPVSLVFVALCFIPIFIILLIISKYHILLAMVMSIFVIVAGFMFSSVGAYISGLVGSSNNPISGVTIATILSSSFIMLLWLGKGSVQGPALSILIGAIVCCAAAIGGDNLQDLKAAHMLGATPWKVQLMQIIGLFLPAITLPLILRLLLTAYGIGTASAEHPNPLPAPQASLMATVTNSIFYGELPINLVGIGMIVGLIIYVLNFIVLELLLKEYTSFRIPVLAVALGFYIPFDLTTPMLFGSVAGWIANYLLTRVVMKGCTTEEIHEQKQQGTQYGLLYCAGLITGESLCGIILAIPIVISRNSHILAIFGQFNYAWPGAILLSLVAFMLIFIVNEKAMFTKPRTHQAARRSAY